MFVQALLEQRQIVNALAAADDFAIAFGRDEIDAQRDFRALFIGLKVEGFDGGGIAVDHDGTVAVLR